MARTLTLSELLPPERMCIGLEAQDYSAAVAKLLDRLDSSGLILDRAEVERLADLEAASGDIPTLGSYTLLGHYRTDAAKDLALALGTSEKTFAFAPRSAPHARILILIVAPRAAAKYYLKIVAALSRLLRETELVKEVVAAPSPEALISVIKRADVEITPELTVQDLMSRRVHTVTPDAPLSEVARLMARHHRHAIPVVGERDEVVGLVTQQDVIQVFLPQILSGVASGVGEAATQDKDVREVMQRNVLCLSEDQLIADVRSTVLSSGGASHFPVVREGVLVGFLSRTDLIQKLIEPSLSHSYEPDAGDR